MPRFDAFVMFAEMRTGSNFLEANLNALPGVFCHGEVFNPHFIARKDQTEYLGIDMAARERDPLPLLARLRGSGGLTGFRFFHDHDPRVLAAVLPDPRVAKIILTRNPLESYVSWKIAQATGQWKLTNAKNLRSAKTTFDPPEFERYLSAQTEFQIALLHGLQTSGQAAFYIDYEDLQDVGVLNGLARFLGVEAVLEAPDETLKKQNPEDIADKVVNPEEMIAAVARLDRFNLSRTPNFEPRRAAAIPSFLVAAGAPLLFMPVRGGPEASVALWLDRIGGGGVIRDLTQRDLRQWKRANPDNRSFTVLRHPVARAHLAFCNQILTGRLPEIRNLLNRAYKLDLPAPGRVAQQPREAHRAGFLGFLRFLKLSLAGQSGARVDASWASQSAVLHGFAQFQTPDLVLRENKLRDGLAFLAAELGVAAPPYAEVADEVPHPLAAIYDGEIEEAAREAYARDYLAFGFGPWG